MKKEKLNFMLTAIFAALFGVFVGTSPLTSFANQKTSNELMDVSFCNHSVDGDSGITNFCSVNRCAILTGQGHGVGPCGTTGGGGPWW
ncbi:hypothetical protein [Cecembia lonarensis]|uniref:Uncharacterized protein n=1 Tax=Cecembia lonarensis (strain CCUG 58316 / KCTC 22772 / LW9) TaxID=1225176 RepID=K1KSZ8_CECL9|nr:hypothetical protein [Cecembia lonarensis]EKB47265.1 hypothetical protein B879_04141 [Cecembia lonarensis LW9]